MADRQTQDRGTGEGLRYVSVHLNHEDRSPVTFSFETQAPRMSGAMGVSLLFHAATVGLTLFLAVWLPTLDGPIDARNAEDRPNLDQITWLAAPGPGGGGGGGGNRSIEPPRKAELPGKDKMTVPVLKPPPVVVPEEKPPEEVLAKQEFNIPALLMASAETTQVGALDGMRTSNSETSLGSGSGGGVGTGTGTGIGPGTGSGLGPGYGGGTGGGVYRPGAGIQIPTLLREVKPQYTADAMRAKIQGVAVLACVVGTDGAVGECDVVRSLDSSFGLDQEAVKAARQWRFVPGRRMGLPVPVLVNIELTFTLR
jgi:protein TonB